MPKVKDIAWEHCKKVEGNHNAVTCIYCNRTFMGGGITRFKRHLAGGDPNVEICTKQGNEVRLQFCALVDKSKKRKNAKVIVDKECQDVLLYVDNSDENLDEDEDEEIVDIRRATQESLAQQWEKNQHWQLSRSENTFVGSTREPGSGSRKNKQSKINSIFHSRSGRRSSSRNTIDLDKSHNGPTRTYVQDAKAMTVTPADVKEYPNSYHFVVDMPGLKSKDIKVQVEDDNVLVISGERKREEEKEGVKYLRMERRVGKFMRKFVLPENANVDKISAVCEDGMLHVAFEKIPPPEPKKPRTIEVKVA